MSKKKELAKNTIIILFGKICTQLISFLLLPLYTSYLITEDYGFVDLIMTYINLFVPIISLQLEAAVFRYLVDVRKDDTKTKEIITNTFLTLFILIFFFTIVYTIIILFVNIKYKWLILLNIIINVFSSIFLQISRGRGEIKLYSFASVITGSFTILFNILFIVVLKTGAVGMILSHIISNFICSVFIFWKLKIKNYIHLKYKNKVQALELIKYSLPLIPNGVSWWIINVSDRTLISIFLGVSANGIYAIANKFPSIFSAFLNVFGMSWTESASLHINDDDRDIFFSSIYNTVIKFFSCIALGIIACMPFVFPLLINNNYSDSYNYIPILLVGSVFNMIVSLYSAIYIAKKMTKQVAYTSIISGILNIIINIGLIKFIGLYAAAISTVLSYLAMVVYRHHNIKKYVNIKYDKKTIILLIIMFTINFITYYINNLIFNIISLILVIIFSFSLNRDIIFKTIKAAKHKLLHQ